MCFKIFNSRSLLVSSGSTLVSFVRVYVSEFCSVRAEPDAGLKLTNREIMTWAEIKSWPLNQLSHPGAPKNIFKSKNTSQGTWVAQSVKCRTLGFSSGHDLTVCEFEPCIGLCTDSGESAWDSLSPSLYHSPAHCLCLKINKLKKNFF